VRAIRKSLATLGYEQIILDRVSPETKAILDGGRFVNFVSGVHVDEIMIHLCEAKGPDAVEALMQHVTASALEGLVGPIARMYLSFGGNSPQSLLRRFNDLLKSVTREIHSTWVQDSETSGHLVVDYPQPVDGRLAHCWTGPLRHLLVFCHFSGTVTIKTPAEKKSASLELHVEWTTAPT
jgi:hypothetical protein